MQLFKRRFFGSGDPRAYYSRTCDSGTTALMLLVGEINDIKRDKSLEESGLVIKDIIKKLTMKQKNEKVDFFLF